MAKWLVVLLVLVFAILAYVVFIKWTMRGVKTPSYSVLQKSGRIEIRHYEPMLVAQVSVTGDRRDALSIGFRTLAKYIFGANHPVQSGYDDQKIAMTAPVEQSSSKIAMTAPVESQPQAGDHWLVRFVMPSQYTIATIPRPDNPDVDLIEQPAKTVVAIRFSGVASTHKLNAERAKLDAYIEKHNLQTQGEPTYAYYNPPWTLPILRRNEIYWSIRHGK